MNRTALPFIATLVVLLTPVAARADDPPAPARGNPFACLGGGEALVNSMRLDQLEDEVRKRVDDPMSEDEPAFDRAVHFCVTAELMRRLGDDRAGEYYERAIEVMPDEPGFELWYGYYLRNVRGPRYPLVERAYEHYQRGLEKVARLRERGEDKDFDAITEDWLQRGLVNLYQEDGLPLFPSKAYPGKREAEGDPGAGLFLTSMFRISRDVNELGVVDDTRRFTSEAAFSASRDRLNRELTALEKWTIARIPLRYEIYNRLRFRPGSIGAFDLSLRVFRAKEAQIERFTRPNEFIDVEVNEVGLGYKRSFTLGAGFDFLLEGSGRLVQRKGIVEWDGDRVELVKLGEFRPVLSRFFGPDKLNLRGVGVYMDIPDITFGAQDDRRRVRSIVALEADYAMYRPIRIPGLMSKRFWTRGWHFYGGYAMDNEVWGVRLVERRDTYAGTTLKGVGGFDFTLQGTMFSGWTTYRRRDPQDGAIREMVDSPQTNSQFRPTFILLYRLVDEDTMPGMPKSPIAMLNLVVPVRHDIALRGAETYENTRIGVELWSKLLFRGFRGTNFLLTAGYDAQIFHNIKKTVHMGHVELRMGWNFL